MEKLLLTVSEAAEVISLGRTKTWQLIRTRELPAIRIGRRVLVPQQALQRWIVDHTDAGQQ
jgi:excisionase family DNA binding protein